MKSFHFSLLALLAFCLASCSKNAAEAVSEQLVNEFQKIPDIIKDVEDLSSAKAASAKLGELGNEVNKILIANKDIKISRSKLKELRETIKVQLKDTGDAIEEKVKALAKTSPEAARELKSGLKLLQTNTLKGMN